MMISDALRFRTARVTPLRFSSKAIEARRRCLRFPPMGSRDASAAYSFDAAIALCRRLQSAADIVLMLIGHAGCSHL